VICTLVKSLDQEKTIVAKLNRSHPRPWSRSFDDGVESTGQWKVESIDRVDRMSLKSSQSTFNTYEVNEISSVITYSVTTAVGANKMFWLSSWRKLVLKKFARAHRGVCRTPLLVEFLKASSEDDMKLIRRLFVRTGNTHSLSSDVLQHFGPLYSE